jgi:hypothetical protein
MKLSPLQRGEILERGEAPLLFILPLPLEGKGVRGMGLINNL